MHYCIFICKLWYFSACMLSCTLLLGSVVLCWWAHSADCYTDHCCRECSTMAMGRWTAAQRLAHLGSTCRWSCFWCHSCHHSTGTCRDRPRLGMPMAGGTSPHTPRSHKMVLPNASSCRVHIPHVLTLQGKRRHTPMTCAMSQSAHLGQTHS